jgi:hypothetical protein
MIKKLDPFPICSESRRFRLSEKTGFLCLKDGLGVGAGTGT